LIVSTDNIDKENFEGKLWYLYIFEYNRQIKQFTIHKSLPHLHVI
jgi:hypothetical protein